MNGCESSTETRALGWLPQIASGGTTHSGGRQRNEDAFAIDNELGFFAIADGMGGHPAGDLAGRTAVSTVHGAIRAITERNGDPARIQAAKEDARDELGRAFDLAAETVATLGRDNHCRMGTTMSAIWIGTHGRASIGHVGDSRIYLVRRGMHELLTRDHTLAAELAQIDSEAEVVKDFENVLTRAIGHDNPRPDLTGRVLKPGDRLLLVTDGLYRMVSDYRLADIVWRETPEVAADTLVRMAVRLGTPDNATALVVAVS